MDRRRFIATSLAGTAGLIAGLPAYAQAYPDRVIKIMQGFAPGGNADTIARLVGAELHKTLGQPVVVESHAGAGGTIASAAVARAKPDGYTLLLATGGHAVAGALYNSLSYQTVNSFEMVSTITYFPFLIVTNAASKLQNFGDLVAQSRSTPTGLAYGTAGIGSTHHLAGELLAKMANLNLLHVPYKGDSASLAALLAGDIPFIIAPATAVMSNIQAGKFRALAATDSQRWSRMPELRTVAEQGVPGYEVRSWAGLMAPAGTPRPIIDRLNAETLKALQVPAVSTRLMEMGGEARGSTPEEMKAMVAAELNRWTQVVAEAKIPKQ